MNDAPFFLDVNVPMYAAGRAHPYKESCVWVLTEIANSRLDVVIDVEIVQEILYRYGAIQRWQVGQEMAKNLLDLIPVVMPVTIEDMKVALTLFAQNGSQGVAARDLLHAAVMQNHQLTHIISTDRHFDQIEGIARLDPQALFVA
jgi:hypothetical protein